MVGSKINHIKRLKRKNSKIMSIVYCMLKNQKKLERLYTYENSFSNVCRKIVWQQKYVPTLTASGINILTRRGKGRYVFNKKEFYSVIYSAILEEEKKEVLGLLRKHKSAFLNKYHKLFKKYEVVVSKYTLKECQLKGRTLYKNGGELLLTNDTYVWKPVISRMYGKQQLKINWIAKQALPLLTEMKRELSDLFSLFLICHVLTDVGSSFYPKKEKADVMFGDLIKPNIDNYTNERVIKDFAKLKNQVKLAYDKLIYGVNNYFIPEMLKGESFSYFEKTLNKVFGPDVGTYKEIKEKLIKLWKQDYKKDGKILLPFVIPLLKKRLELISRKLIH